MTATAELGLPRAETLPPQNKRRLPVLPVAALLEAQSTLTAVERFAKQHDAGEVPAQQQFYRDLIPLERPRPGEQYAFEVDLDACTGCKACVAACHSLNGLDEGEMWRTVGLLHGGTPVAPALQTVTTSCHHCLEPACMKGCPVGAYEKDAVTGIVKHLDDQCFGCQYCTLMCPYDAPKYNKARGIVRKCDMCSDRLSHGEAPACVQACPNEAIRIQIVDRASAVATADAQNFLPGAPAPEHTLPTTTYKSRQPMPNNMLPADFYRVSPEHSHPPLVVMLTLTQLSVGAFGLCAVVERLSGRPAGSPVAQAALACTLAFVALFASVFHLGRPWLAWRAFIGLRTSWLSREAVAFGLFAKLAVLYGVLASAPILPDFPLKAELVDSAPSIQTAAALVGAIAVFFSVMVYVATQRAQWSGTQTGIKFFGSALILGAAAVLTVSGFTAAGGVDFETVTRALLFLVLGATSLKVAFEASGLRHRADRQHSVLKRMARVMLADLRHITGLRFGLSLLGGIVLPLVLLYAGVSEPAAHGLTLGMFLLLLGGELCERTLFFCAAPASRMPGGIG